MNQTAPQSHPFLAGGEKLMLIGGRHVPSASGRTFASISPIDGSVLAHVADGDAVDVDRAVAAARAAFEGPWGKAKPFERQELILRIAEAIDRHFDELSTIDSLDMGAPISVTRARRRRLLGLLRFYAGQATSIHGETIENSLSPGEYVTYTQRDPVGVVGAIIPWNAPFSSSIGKLGPVLATGCTLVLKPSELACLSIIRLGEVLMEAGLPEGVVNIVTGHGAVGAALAAHPDVDKITFTGSVATGQKVIQASAGNLKRVTLELGGKSPDIVFADADLDAAAFGAAMGAFANSGQVCFAGTRLFVERSIYDDFLERVSKASAALRIGHSLDPETQIGPLVSADQLGRVTSFIKSGLEEGARMAIGGEQLTEGALAKGYYLPPTVFAGVKDDMRIAREEIFGPVLSTFVFDDMDELVKRANSTIFGLGSGVWTRDVSKAHFLAKSIRAGNVWVNSYGALDVAMPFGGYKMSGYGRESGRESLDAYLNTKAVYIRVA